MLARRTMPDLMHIATSVTAPVAAGRFAAFDRLGGLIIVLMAIDHASYFIARVHGVESWAWGPPSCLRLVRAVQGVEARGIDMAVVLSGRRNRM